MQRCVALFNVQRRSRRIAAFGEGAHLQAWLQAANGSAISEIELLETLLGIALHGRDNRRVARHLLSRFGGLSGVFRAKVSALRGIDGLDDAGVAVLKIVPMVLEGLVKPATRSYPNLNGSERLAEHVASRRQSNNPKRWWVLFLDGRYQLLAETGWDFGTETMPVIGIEDLLSRALDSYCSRLVITRVGRSELPKINLKDVEIVGAAKRACKTLGIQCYDYVIIGAASVRSFRDSGLL